jgi:signal transduction histidine kinase/DNA-binding response OmpR family regulator
MWLSCWFKPVQTVIFMVHLRPTATLVKASAVTALFLALCMQVLGQDVFPGFEKSDSIKKIALQAEGLDRATQLFALAKLYVPHNLDSSKAFFEEALSICLAAKNDTTAIKFLCQYQRPLSNAGEHNLARHYLVQARDMTSADALIPKYRVMIYQALHDLHYWHFTDYDSCIYYVKKWIDADTDSNSLAVGYLELGNSYGRQGNNTKALEIYNEANAFMQTFKADPWTLHHINNSLGMLYSDEREYRKAEGYFLKGLDYAQESKVPGADMAELNNLGLLYNWLGEYDKSLKYLRLAAERAPLKNDAWMSANNVLNVGNTLTLAGQPAEGLVKYKEAIGLFEKIKDEYKIASLHLLMAEAYRLLGRYDEAEREGLMCLKWDLKSGYGDLTKDSYKELNKIYAATKQFGKAYDYQTRYLKIIDSLNSAERRTKFGLLEKNYELAQQEKVREGLERQNELHLAQASVDRTTRMSLITGTVVFFIAMVAAGAAYRRSKSQKEKIEEQAEQLREAAKTKARFFANVSHELRTPVTLLNGMLELMQEDPAKEGTAAKMEIALGSSRRLQGMLNEVLDLSRVEGGKWELAKKQKQVVPLMNRIVLAFESLMVKKNLKLEYNPSSLNGLVMDLDEDKFEKIINNLLYNAIKFNHEGGWIRVTADRSEDFLVIQVADSGVGIPEKELPYIFDRFYQSSSTDKLNSQGIGIGLSLVKEFTVLHGGDVNVTSRENEGSCFTVQLPIRGTGVVSEAVEEGGDIDVTFDNFSRKPQVLIVEDNDDMRFYLKEILGGHVSIAEARHGREGLTWLKTHKADLVISDVMMPEMDGYEFLAQLKASPTHRGMPVVMLTARAAEEDLLQGLSLGVDDYIIKPFNAKELKIRIHNLLTNQEIRKEWIQKPVDAEEIIPASSFEDQALLDKIRMFVEEHAGNSSLGIADLGDYLAMSERQVYRKTATLTGMSPAHLIKEIRMKIAYRLLLERKVTKVAELASRVGFENSSYFSRQFLERYGKRPADLL